MLIPLSKWKGKQGQAFDINDRFAAQVVQIVGDVYAQFKHVKEQATHLF